MWGSLIGAGVSLLGSKLAGGQDQRAADAGIAAGRQYIPPELLSGLMRAATQGEGALKRSRRFDRGGLQAMEARELSRLQALRAPSIEQARTRLQSQLLNRGRLGVGVGGGRSGGLFNPETAALEEAILSAQLGDIGAARQSAVSESERLFGRAQGLFNIAGPLIERANPYAGQLAAMPGMNQASTTRGFFSGLGNAIGSAGFFGGGFPAGMGL